MHLQNNTFIYNKGCISLQQENNITALIASLVFTRKISKEGAGC